MPFLRNLRNTMPAQSIRTWKLCQRRAIDRVCAVGTVIGPPFRMLAVLKKRLNTPKRLVPLSQVPQHVVVPHPRGRIPGPVAETAPVPSQGGPSGPVSASEVPSGPTPCPSHRCADRHADDHAAPGWPRSRPCYPPPSVFKRPTGCRSLRPSVAPGTDTQQSGSRHIHEIMVVPSRG